MVLKQTFQLLDQPPLCAIMLATASSRNHTDPFADAEEDKDELEENKLVLEDANAIILCILVTTVPCHSSHEVIHVLEISA